MLALLDDQARLAPGQEAEAVQQANAHWSAAYDLMAATGRTSGRTVPTRVPWRSAAQVGWWVPRGRQRGW